VPILLVEDDAASRKLAQLLLAAAGARVTAVPSAEAALAALERSLPRVMVLDLVLPEMDGFELIDHLRGRPATRDLVIVAVTSLNGPETERQALAAGCSGYVRKPIDTEEFAATVAKYIGE
jgi:two-component system, cell cycle response regulator DivK